MRLIIPIVMLMFCLSGCVSSRQPWVSLDDVSAERIIPISKQKLGARTLGVEVRIQGQIDGTARLELMLGDKPIAEKDVVGKFDTEMHSDWFEDVIYIKYVPHSVSHGRIGFQCHFIDATKWPNKALVPTVMAVTPAADAPVAPATTAAHL